MNPDQFASLARRLDRIERKVDVNVAAAKPEHVVGLLTAKEKAIELQTSTEWVRRHADELGAIRLGDGPKARLRFRPGPPTSCWANRESR